MKLSKWASPQTAFGAAGVTLTLHAAFAILTFERTGPPCHVCIVTPGLWFTALELVIGVPVAALGVAVFSAPRFDPTVTLQRYARIALLVGPLLTLGVLVLELLPAGDGVPFALPLIYLGYALVLGGVVAGVVAELRRIATGRGRTD